MATRNKEPDRDALHIAGKHPSEGSIDADAVAMATSKTLGEVNVLLTPVVGELGVNVLLKRSLHLTSRAYPWLAIADNHENTDDFLERLRERLAGRETRETVEVSSALLAGFTELLASLIGNSLVDTLLGPLSASLAPSYTLGTTPRQDASS